MILELRFNRAYQQRERRAYRCWAPVTGGKKHYTKTPLRKDFPSMIDCRDPSNVVLPFVHSRFRQCCTHTAAGNYLFTDPGVDPYYS